MSSSDDDVPLARGSKSSRALTNGSLFLTCSILNGLARFFNTERSVLIGGQMNFHAWLAEPDSHSKRLIFLGAAPKSKDVISKNVDNAMDKANPTLRGTAPGISIRNGPVEEMDIDGPSMNGLGTNNATKRKARNSIGNGKTYKEASDDEEDDKPLVSHKTLEVGI